MEDVIFAGTAGPPAAGPRRGRPDDRQHRRRAADRLLRGHDLAHAVPQRRLGVRDQRHRVPAAGHPGAALATPASAARCTSSSARASSTPCCAPPRRTAAASSRRPPASSSTAGARRRRCASSRRCRATSRGCSDLTAEIRRQLGPLGKQAEVARQAQTIQADVRDARARLLADDLAQLTAALEQEVADETALLERREQVETALAQARAGAGGPGGRGRGRRAGALRGERRLLPADARCASGCAAWRRSPTSAPACSARRRPRPPPAPTPTTWTPRPRGPAPRRPSWATEVELARAALDAAVDRADRGRAGRRRRGATGRGPAARRRRPPRGTGPAGRPGRGASHPAGGHRGRDRPAARRPGRGRAPRSRGHRRVHRAGVHRRRRRGGRGGPGRRPRVRRGRAGGGHRRGHRARAHRAGGRAGPRHLVGAGRGARAEPGAQGRRRHAARRRRPARRARARSPRCSASEPGYEDAIAAALGPLADAVAVASVDAAVDALRRLREVDGGRAALVIGAARDRRGERAGAAAPARCGRSTWCGPRRTCRVRSPRRSPTSWWSTTSRAPAPWSPSGPTWWRSPAPGTCSARTAPGAGRAAAPGHSSSRRRSTRPGRTSPRRSRPSSAPGSRWSRPAGAATRRRAATTPPWAGCTSRTPRSPRWPSSSGTWARWPGPRGRRPSGPRPRSPPPTSAWPPTSAS